MIDRHAPRHTILEEAFLINFQDFKFYCFNLYKRDFNLIFYIRCFKCVTTTNMLVFWWGCNCHIIQLFWGSLKNPNFRGGGFTKNQYRGGGDCLKRGAWTVSQFKIKGAWQETGGGVLEGGLIPQCTIESSQNHLTHVLIQPSVIASN